MAAAIVNGHGRMGWPLLALVAWGVFSFGAVYPWAYWPLFAASAALGIAGLAGDQAWRDVRLRRVMAAAGVLALAILVQIVALPSWLILELSPGVDRFFREFRLGYHPSDLRTLSIDPDATRVVLAEVVAFSLLLVGVARMLRRWPLEWLVSQVMALAVVVALVGILQKALLDADTRLVYGFWVPRQGGEIFGPFVNRNHFAGWMLMAMPLVGAYGWAHVQAARAPARTTGTDWLRWFGTVEGNRALLVLACLLVMTVSLVMTGSRSGLAAGTAGMLVLVSFIWPTVAGRARVLVTVLVLAIILGATAWSGASVVVSRFGRAAVDVGGRLSAWQDTLRLASDFPWFGTGLGGYRQAMLLYQTLDREAFYAQAHNDYLQLFAEGGALVIVPAVCLVLLVAAGIVRRLRTADADGPVTRWIRRGAVAGIAGIAAQSVVEFSLQMPGNAVLFVALVAIALHRPRSNFHANRI